ncbi:MAG: DUF1569 domain-containing protein [Bacteroidia bacterium]
MAEIYERFFSVEVPELLERLSPESAPLWGIMGPQHMVEHVSGLFYISRNNLGIKCSTPEDKLPRIKEFIWNDAPFPRSVRVQGIPRDSTLPLRFSSLDEAKAVLLKNIQAFFGFFAQNPDASTMHPVFGPLNFEEWKRIHWKHTLHHLRQFGLTGEDA